jgi:uncharacterized protein YbjT (DUF2867 family)
MILIVGASGNLGKATVRRLLAAGERVRAMSRAPEQLADWAAQGVEVVRGDLLDPASLARACAGVEGVLAAAHAFDSRGGNVPQAVDDAGNRRLMDAARLAGVRHFVLTSILTASADHPVDLFRCKYRAEQYLLASGLSYTILRPTAYMETWVALIGDPLVRTGKAMIFGRGTNPINFVAVEDVAQVAVAALTERAPGGRGIAICGPENLSLTQVAQTVDHALGRHSPQRHIPRAMLRLMGTAARPFNRTFARQATAAYWMDTADMHGDPTALLAEFPMEMTRLEAVAQRLYGAPEPARR